MTCWLPGPSAAARCIGIEALVSPSVVIPVKGGSLALGTWQGVVLVDLNTDNPQRRVRLDLLSG